MTSSFNLVTILIIATLESDGPLLVSTLSATLTILAEARPELIINTLLSLETGHNPSPGYKTKVSICFFGKQGWGKTIVHKDFRIWTASREHFCSYHYPLRIVTKSSVTHVFLYFPVHGWWCCCWYTISLTFTHVNIVLTSPHQLLALGVFFLDHPLSIFIIHQIRILLWPDEFLSRVFHKSSHIQTRLRSVSWDTE